jgi:ferric-dicitrate binding protein FerR (iron transport regulator)
VRHEWQSNYERRRTLRWGIPFALAASAVVLAFVVLRAPEVAVAPVATVALLGDGAASGNLAPGDAVYPGTVLATGARGIALTLNNGLSVRLDAGTTVTFESAESVVLEAGRVYADTGQSIYHDRSITVRTAVGSATDVGTQFAVAFDGDDMRIAVREGRVDVTADGNGWTAQAGDLLMIAPDSGATFERVAQHDDSWEWASSLAPPFDIESRSLLDFLKWAARETGRELVFESEETRLAAMRTTLSGSIENFTPMEAVDSVMPTTRFVWRVEGGRIVVRGPSP